MPDITLEDAMRMAAEHREAGRLVEARDIYEQIIAQRPGHMESCLQLADVFVLLAKLPEAQAMYEWLLTVDPNNLSVLNNLAVALYRQERNQEAMVYVQRALDIEPRSAAALCSMGSLLSQAGELEEAVEHLERAIAIQPDFVEAMDNLGVALLKQGKLEESEQCQQRVVALKADYAQAHSNMGMVKLLRGDFEGGWKEYEWRKKVPEAIRHQTYPQFSQWDGSDLTGKTILLYNEQGLGDTIQFIRYVPQVVARGATVIIECQKVLKPLLKGFPGTKQVLGRGEELPAFDVHCALMSLPYVFGTTLKTIPNQVPYLHADPAKASEWRYRMAGDRTFKVGLVWAGRPTHKGDKQRSLSLARLAPLAQAKYASFFTLQKGKAAEQGNTPPAGMNVIHCSSELTDFTDTAALVANLDLVITVDTSVAHLVGAMGKPVWTLLPYVPDWRWMMDRKETPWYPTMRLVRQTSPGDWEGVIAKVAEELAGFTQNLKLRFS